MKDNSENTLFATQGFPNLIREGGRTVGSGHVATIQDLEKFAQWISVKKKANRSVRQLRYRAEWYIELIQYARGITVYTSVVTLSPIDEH